MRDHKKLIYCVILILLIVISILYFYPRKFNKEYSGVLYRLGDNAYSENIKVTFDGYISKGLFEGDKFQGIINIGDKKLTRTILRFNSSNSPFREKSAIMDYYDEGLGEYRDYGNMISKNIKDGFTILVLEADKDNSADCSWSSENGLMISAPANSRSEALAISKGILRDQKLN